VLPGRKFFFPALTITQKTRYPGFMVITIFVIDPDIWFEFEQKSCCLRQRGCYRGEAEEQGNAM
jgi:hypothetical protein